MPASLQFQELLTKHVHCVLDKNSIQVAGHLLEELRYAEILVRQTRWELENYVAQLEKGKHEQSKEGST